MSLSRSWVMDQGSGNTDSRKRINALPTGCVYAKWRQNQFQEIQMPFFSNLSHSLLKPVTDVGPSHRICEYF